MLDEKIFTISEGINRQEYIIGIYYMESRTADILKKAEAIALEESTGTWVEVPEESEDIRARCVAKVLGVYDIPNYEDEVVEDANMRRFLFLLGFPAANINGQLPQLLTALYGNISMAGRIKLLDIHLPESFVKLYKGPKFGIEGLRKRLKIPRRPLVVAMFKPCVGMSPKQIGRLFYELGMAGVDIIKDDELLADPEFCKVEERLKECLKSLKKVKSRTGREPLYAINITDNLERMMKRARDVVDMGANCIMVNTYTVGFPALSALAEDSKIKVPVMTHPDFAGSMFMSPYYGLSSNLVLGKLARLSGSDMVIYPSHFGKVPMVKERLVRIAQELRADFYHLKRVFPGPSAGMHPGVVPQLVEDFGDDVLVAAGGGIHAHPMGVKAGVKAFHQALYAAIEGIPIEEAAKNKRELKAALKKWGSYKNKESIYTLIR